MGDVTTALPKNITNVKKLKQKTLYLENIGESDVNELEVAASSPKHTALISRRVINEYTENGHISYSMLFDRKIRKNEIVILDICYLEEDPVIDMFGASIDVYYRDSLNNTCLQPLFPEQDNIYEPTAIDYREWREHVNVRKNLEHWQERLA